MQYLYPSVDYQLLTLQKTTFATFMAMQGSLKLTPLINRWHAVTVIINKSYTSDAVVKLMRSGYNV